MWNKVDKIMKGNLSRPFDSGDAEALFRKGMKLLLKSKDNQANEYINKAVEIMISLNEKDDAVNSLKKVGEYCVDIHKHKKAMIYYERAAALKKEHTEETV